MYVRIPVTISPLNWQLEHAGVGVVELTKKRIKYRNLIFEADYCWREAFSVVPRIRRWSADRKPVRFLFFTKFIAKSDTSSYLPKMLLLVSLKKVFFSASWCGGGDTSFSWPCLGALFDKEEDGQKKQRLTKYRIHTLLSLLPTIRIQGIPTYEEKKATFHDLCVYVPRTFFQLTCIASTSANSCSCYEQEGPPFFSSSSFLLWAFMASLFFFSRGKCYPKLESRRCH